MTTTVTNLEPKCPSGERWQALGCWVCRSAAIIHSSALRKWELTFPRKCLTVPVEVSSGMRSVKIQPTGRSPSRDDSSFTTSPGNSTSSTEFLVLIYITTQLGFTSLSFRSLPPDISYEHLLLLLLLLLPLALPLPPLFGLSCTKTKEREHTHTHSILTAIFPGEPGLAGCRLNSRSPFIPVLHILLGQA